MLRSAVLFAASVMALLSCAYDAEEAPAAPEAAVAVLPLVRTEASKRHHETELTPGVAEVDGDVMIFREDGRVLIGHDGLHEWWNEATRTWSVGTDLPPADEPDVDPETPRVPALAPFGVAAAFDEGVVAGSSWGDTYRFVEIVSKPGGLRLGVLQTAATGPARLHELPQRKTPYANYPGAVITNAPDDVWVFGGTTSGKDFGEDFPGCPSTIRHSQDGGYVAHFDGDRWTEIAWPHADRFGDARRVGDELVVTVGEDPREGVYGSGLVPLPQKAYRLAWEGGAARWTPTELPQDPAAEALGWTQHEGHVEHEGHIIDLTLPGTVLDLVAVDRHQAFVQIAQSFALRDADPVLEVTWLHVTRP